MGNRTKQKERTIVLGIETSCDETAAAIVDSDKTVHAHKIFSQLKPHQPFGGVVPEIGARTHLASLLPIVQEVLKEAQLSLDQLDGIAAACGPGLIGGVLVGAMTGKSLAAFHHKPFIAVNHLEAHALMVRMVHDVPFPYVLLLISGGHSQYLIVHGVGSYTELGSTIDDAVGECFDKVARLLGLDYPGGPALERCALSGDPKRFSFPSPLLRENSCRLSFSGLKTAVRYKIESLGTLSDQDRNDIAASFQYTVAQVLANKSLKALQEAPESRHFVVSGGVGSNLYIRSRLEETFRSHNVTLVCPPPALCVDNGAMVAWAGLERLQQGLTSDLDFAPRPRWPLTLI